MSFPARSPYLCTAPSEHERCYEMAVVVPVRTRLDYRIQPWIRITANCLTDEVSIAAGFKVKRSSDEDDGA